MRAGLFYVYALKDPRASPAKIFYVGKGTGSRAWQHLARADNTRKGRRIREIKTDSLEPIVVILAEELVEGAAIKLEAELVTAFGTEDTGGLLTNSVVPSGRANPKNSKIVTPPVALERAQIGLELLKGAVLDLAAENSGGITNSDVANHLGLQSDHDGKSLNYLSYSILGILLRERRLRRTKPASGTPKYKLQAN